MRSVGTVIENAGVKELPLNGRSYLGLVALAANTNTLSPSSGQAGSRQGGDRASQSISAAGNRIMFDYFTLDGVNNTDPNFLTYVVLPSIDAIQEFKVQTGVYPAEFGHESTQVNVLTKSGGNAYHGALFEFVRNDKFDAVPYAFTRNHPTKSPFKWNDYGFEIDGPVRIPKLFDGRNKLFFMANDEWKSQRQNSQGIYSVPTAAMFKGDMSGLGTIIYDPNTGAGGATQDSVSGQCDSQQPAGSDLAEVSEILCPRHTAGPLSELHSAQLLAEQPGRFHAAHGLGGIGQIAMERAVQLG